jgi:hypothetical protein
VRHLVRYLRRRDTDAGAVAREGQENAAVVLVVDALEQGEPDRVKRRLDPSVARTEAIVAAERAQLRKEIRPALAREVVPAGIDSADERHDRLDLGRDAREPAPDNSLQRQKRRAPITPAPGRLGEVGVGAGEEVGQGEGGGPDGFSRIKRSHEVLVGNVPVGVECNREELSGKETTFGKT